MSLTDLGATTLLELLKTRELSSRELVQSYLEAISENDEEINAMAVPLYERALEQAVAVDRARASGSSVGRLGGLPLTVKESFDVTGTPTTAGVARLGRQPSGGDAAVVAALRREGAVVLGKTNLGQLSWMIETSNPVYGRTNNPWDPARTPGGSSGGEAAAVSAGMSPVGIGTDSGGSVRLPASYCGIHALKPTSGRLSNRGTVDEVAVSFQPVVVSQPGVLARRVSDVRLLYSVLASSPESSPPGRGPRRAHPPGEHPRVGFFSGEEVFEPSPAIRRLLDESVAALGESGYELREFEAPSLGHVTDLFDALFSLDAGEMLRSLICDSEVDPILERTLATLPPRPATTEEARAVVAQCRAYRTDFERALDEQAVDVLLCPVTGVVAHPHSLSDDLGDYASTVILFNLLGLPAGVVSLTRVQPGEEFRALPASGGDAIGATENGSAGLPVAVQVAGRRWEEEVVLRIMAALETGTAGSPPALRPAGS